MKLPQEEYECGIESPVFSEKVDMCVEMSEGRVVTRLMSKLHCTGTKKSASVVLNCSLRYLQLLNHYRKSNLKSVILVQLQKNFVENGLDLS